MTRCSDPAPVPSRRDLDAAAGVAWEASVQGGRVLLDHFRRGVAAERKTGGEPVSVADRDADVAIARVLREAFPDDGLLSEEATAMEAEPASGRVWVVDPLDGTRDFLEGVEEFAVHVALAIHGEAVVGAVYDPCANRGGLAILGGGCREFDDRRVGEPLRMRPTRTPLRVVVSRSRFGPDQERLLNCLAPVEPIRCGSSGCKVLRLAFGDADVYLGATPGMAVWDLAAPHRVLEEAGGRGSDLLGRPLQYRRDALRMTRGFLGTNAADHATILSRLAPGLSDLPWLR